MTGRGRPKHPDILTPREWDVLALLREDCSNDEVAARLGISLATAKFHVSQILGKLGVSSRVDAARWQLDPPDAHRPRRFWLAAPLALFRRGSVGASAGARVVAGGAFVVALGGVALLIFGVTRTAGDRSSSPSSATVAETRPPGAGARATEAGIVAWQTYRISGGDLPHAITVPFTEYMLATDSGRPSPDGAPAPAPPAGTTTYRLEFVRADDGVTPVGSAGAYIRGATSLIQPPSIGGRSLAPQPWQEASAVVAAMLDRYIALGDAVTDRPALGESIYATQRRDPTAVDVGGRTLTQADAGAFLSLFGATSPVRFGLRGTLVGQRALNAATVEVRLGAETLTFSYIPPGLVAPYGLLMGTQAVGNWEFSTLLDPPAYVQDAYSVPKELDDLMTRLGFVGGTLVQNADTRIMPMLDADMTMRINQVTLSDGTRDASVTGVDPDSIDCPTGVDVCRPDAAALPADGHPLTLTVSRRGVDPFPEAQRPAEYSYYPPGAAGARGILVQTKMGEIWNATLGRDGGEPYYASAATDAALRSAVRQLAGQPPEAQATLTPRTALVAFKEDGASMSVLDPASGKVLGTVPIGYASWAIVRASAQQLLVSQAFGTNEEAATLRIYALSDLQTPIASLPMPDRTVSTVDYPFMVLSFHERYLYYGKNRSICANGGEACDAPSVGVIDLQTRTELPAAALPVGCNPPVLAPLGASDALASCRATDQVLMRVSHDGLGTEIARFADSGAANAVIADVDGNGNAYMIGNDGALVTMPALKRTALLPASSGHIGFQTPSLLDESTWVAAYGPDNGGYDGVLVIPRDHPEQAHAIRLPMLARFVTAWDAHAVAAIADDGSGGYVFDIAGRTITSHFAVAAGADVLTAR